MKDSYFISVISDISSLCSAVMAKEDCSSVRVETLSLDDDDLKKLLTVSKEEQALKAYLMGLTDTTLNTICALMDFGRQHAVKLLPINLTATFNKYYLPYWFDKNKDDEKEWTVNYLIDKVGCLSKYLRRAEELLIYSKDKEIKLEHDDCGGALVEDEDQRYVFRPWTEKDEYDEQDYELHLKCLKCNREVTKIVGRSYFKQQI